MRCALFSAVSAVLVVGTPASATPPALTVSADGRFLVTRDGRPFTYVADTAYELFARLDRDEVVRYLDDRARRRFTVVLAAAISPFGGCGANAYGARACDRSTDRLLTTPGADPKDRAQYDYWDHVDYAIDEAARRGLTVALNTVWTNHVSLDDRAAVTARNAEAYGRFLGARYRDRTNLIWIIGGDVSRERTEPAGWRALWTALARGIVLGVAGVEDHRRVLMSFHPTGPGSSAPFFHAEPWLDFNAVQTGHNRDRAFPYQLIEDAYARQPPKPVVDYEPPYDDILRTDMPEGRNEAIDGRKAAYWSVLAGALGATYGHVSLFQMYQPGRKSWDGARLPWTEALAAEGADQMRHLRALLESRPVVGRVPDQALVADPLSGAAHVRAARGDGYAFVYSAEGRPFQVNLGRIGAPRLLAWWFDPRTGRARRLGPLPGTGQRRMTPPSAGRGHDWLLVLDDARRRAAPPGAPRVRGEGAGSLNQR